MARATPFRLMTVDASRMCWSYSGVCLIIRMIMSDRPTVRRMGEERETANAQTQRLASLGFMVASVCHEVSNPLAAVHSMLQILQSKRGVTPETLEKGLASISPNLSGVLAITKKRGDFSRVGPDEPVPVAA